MPTIPELLRFETQPGTHVEVVLRSGQTLTGPIDEVDLIGNIVPLDGWTIRVEETAGIRT